MKTAMGFTRLPALGAAFLLAFLTARSYGSNIVIGYGAGYSAALTKQQYNRYDMDYTSAKLRTCSVSSIGIASGHISLLLETFNQKYDEIGHWMSPSGYVAGDPYQNGFLYFGVALEYRFFEDIRRTWNPYVSLGACALFYLDLFGGGPPEYPKSGSFKMTAGTRIHLIHPVYLNPRVVYLSGNSSVSFQAGIDLII